MKKIAVRNLRLCTKDCLCLYVCPTGATDTENSIIDTDKCLGCGTCAAACPSAAISMVPVEYPPQQKKEEKVLAASYALAKSKAKQEKMLENPKLIKTPVVRDGKRATVGYCPEIWKQWLAENM